MKKKLMVVISILIFITHFTSCAYSSQFIPVLMYHHLDEELTNSTVITPEKFREQMQLLKSMGYQTITNEDYYLFLEDKKSLPDNPVMITFDDGYLSNYLYAYPILKELNMKATIFVISSYRGKTPGYYTHFSWEEAQEMYHSGVIDIQSHSHNSHVTINTIQGEKPSLVGKLYINDKEETTSAYEERIREDLLKSKQLIEQKVENKVISLSYPFGAFNKTTQRIAQEVGCKMTFIIENDVNYKERRPYLLKRINVSGNDSGSDILNKILWFTEGIAKYKNKIILEINEKMVFPEQEPFIVRKRVFVPIRFVAKNLGCTLNWNNDTKELTIIKDKEQINVDFDTLDVTPILKEGRVFIPLRFIAENLNAHVNWVPRIYGSKGKVQIIQK